MTRFSVPVRLNRLTHKHETGDELVMKTAIGVLGDLADTLGSKAGLLIQQSLLSKVFLNECFSSEDNLIKEAAEWTK
ncbi:putative armadillo-like helical, importin beta family [Helianthus annuus]|nr:putative armadillo-like helical, importin beta family [Helianthus annuus]KAJ0776766.1 putative armadillo-like helical, importin beta family [Helianthus annuus]